MYRRSIIEYITGYLFNGEMEMDLTVTRSLRVGIKLIMWYVSFSLAVSLECDSGVKQIYTVALV